MQIIDASICIHVADTKRVGTLRTRRDTCSMATIFDDESIPEAIVMMTNIQHSSLEERKKEHRSKNSILPRRKKKIKSDAVVARSRLSQYGNGPVPKRFQCG
jgi:hypothetical protein